MILFIIPLAIWLYNQAGDIASGIADFLRSIPSLLAPKPTPLSSTYSPPFTGGQCPDMYLVTFQRFATRSAGVEGDYGINTLTLKGAITGAGFRQSGQNANGKTYEWFILAQGGSRVQGFGSVGDYLSDLVVSGRTVIISVVRQDGGVDNCGNLPNPNPAPSIPDDGLFKPTNPTISDNNDVINPQAIVLAPAAPLVLVTALAAGYAAALAAAKAAADALEAVKKIAEGLEALKSLWDKLKEFLDEWEKNRPKKRDIVRQTYGQIVGDGALDFFSSNNKKAQAIQLDIVITSIPSGISKYYGSLSPSRYRYKELGYIAFYSVNQGILETHSLQFRRTTLQIPELAVGFIYHLGLDEAIRGYAFATFSIEKE